MFKVSNGQDPYSAIGKYIRDHITAIEDIIAVIKIDEVETNQLFMVDIKEENYFIWKNDWWEGEEDVTLIDFFPVSEAQRANHSVQSADTISRKAAIEALRKYIGVNKNPNHDARIWEEGMNCALTVIGALPSAQPERTEYIPDTKAVRSKRDCVDLAERVNATFYDQEYEEWTQKTVTIADVLDSVCDEYTILPSAQPEPHYCRECKWSRCHIYVDKYGNTETYWHCHNWDGETDEEGYCYEWERKIDE